VSGLGRQPDLQSVRLHRLPVASLEHAWLAPRLRSMELSELIRLSVLPELVDPSALVTLKITDCWSLRDLAPLSGLTNLEELSLAGSQSLTHLRQLANLESVRRVDLSNCVSIVDVAPLAHLPRLEQVTLTGCHPGLDTSPLVHVEHVVGPDVALSQSAGPADAWPLA
jgi:hypothetical protein